VPKELTPAERQALKGRAHRLKPVVLIGEAGLTPTVAAEIERALTAHGLVKIRVIGAERGVRAALLAEVCAATAAAPVQHIGKVLVVYRERPPDAG
jgi:putative YhbY family RNA-binding protein